MAYEQSYDPSYEQNYENSDYQYDENGQYAYYNPNVIAWATALYPYEAAAEGELSFNDGDLIGILEEHEDGWTRGDLHGVEGLFPASYVQKTETYDESTSYDYSQQPNQDDAAAKRREKKEKMRGEMKDLKSELQQEEKKRAKLENDIKVLTETKQKLKKEIRQQKANLSDKSSIMFDLIKLSYGVDIYSDSIADMQQPTLMLAEALSVFNSELQKEAKASPALAPFVSKISPKFKDLKEAMDSSQTLAQETIKLREDFSKELESVIKLLDPKK